MFVVCARGLSAALCRLNLMQLSDSEVEFSDDDLREVFALFSSPSAYELGQIYDPANEHYYQRVELSEEYDLSYEKREFAADALRAAFAFLHRHGYRVGKDGVIISLEGILEHFVE